MSTVRLRAACPPPIAVLFSPTMNGDLFDNPATTSDETGGSDSAAYHPLLDGLNTEQRAAVTTTEGPLLVLAGAGSGKTRVITHRIAWLVQECGVEPWRILAVTFSNKAAGEMRERIERLLGGSSASLWLGTFHAIGVRLLRSFGEHVGLNRSFSIYDRDDQLRMIGRVMKAMSVSDKVFNPRAIAGYIDRAKNRCLLPDDPRLPAGGVQERKAAEVYAAYEKEMRIADAVDFGDLLMRPVQLLTKFEHLRASQAERFRYLLVDEFQDTNQAQYALLELLSSHHGNLCVVGDDDQSIYSWRGAEISNILEFPDAHANATVIKLERNYRSTRPILEASTAVVSRNRSRHGKVLWTEQAEGPPIRAHVASDDREEAEWIARTIERLSADIALDEIAVFYRTNAQSRLLEEAMRRFRLPYLVIGGHRFYERAEIKDALAYARLLVNPRDSAGWLRIVNTPRRGIGAKAVEAVNQLAQRQSCSLPEACEAIAAQGRTSGLRGVDKLQLFVALIGRLRDGLTSLRADQAGRMILEHSGLLDALREDGSLEAQGRIENLQELVTAMREHAERADNPTLVGFLEQVALVSDVDALSEKRQSVSLMTMHAAKGLEYDVTFLAGLEEGLVPHGNSAGDVAGLEEECRLLYVAMTRARKKMHLSYALARRRFGGWPEPTVPSPFLSAIPGHLLEGDGLTGRGVGTPGLAGRSGSSGGGGARHGSFGGGLRARIARLDPPVRVDDRGDGTRIEHDADGGAPGTGARVGHDGKGAAQGGDAADANSDAGRSGAISVGGQVVHVTFGRGDVLDVSGSGGLARVTVRFGRVGMKKILARFLRPA